jgi:hypothetical protein
LRYRDGFEISSTAELAPDWMIFGVWITLVAGLCLLLLGFYGKQQWLKFWGVLMVSFCTFQLTIGLETVLSRAF